MQIPPPSQQPRRLHRLATLGSVLVDRGRRKLPTLALALRLSGEADLVDRAAALTLFCIFAAVPSLFVAFSVVGFLIGAVDQATELTGADLALRGGTLARISHWLHQALPGVTWNPADFAATLVRHRATHGVVGTLLAVSLSLTVFNRIDSAVRAIFGKSPRSTLRAAGYISLLVLIVAFAAMLLSIMAPLTEWGLQVAARSIGTLSLGWLDGVAVLVTAGQILPVALVFAAQVRWSAGRILGRRLAIAAAGFGAFWFVGQRLFSLYVSEVVKMDAVYGALTGIIALMLWLFYANIAFLFATALLAAWEHRARHSGNGHGREAVAHLDA